MQIKGFKERTYLKARFTRKWAACCSLRGFFFLFNENKNWFSGNVKLEKQREQGIDTHEQE